MQNLRVARQSERKHRPLNQIAKEIDNTWWNISPHALPYLTAMKTLDQIEDTYLLDSASYIVSYFLANAAGFRGEEAKRIKAELKHILTLCDNELAGINSRAAYKNPSIKL